MLALAAPLLLLAGLAEAQPHPQIADDVFESLQRRTWLLHNFEETGSYMRDCTAHAMACLESHGISHDVALCGVSRALFLCPLLPLSAPPASCSAHSARTAHAGAAKLSSDDSAADLLCSGIDQHASRWSSNLDEISEKIPVTAAQVDAADRCTSELGSSVDAYNLEAATERTENGRRQLSTDSGLCGDGHDACQDLMDCQYDAPPWALGGAEGSGGQIEEDFLSCDAAALGCKDPQRFRLSFYGWGSTIFVIFCCLCRCCIEEKKPEQRRKPPVAVRHSRLPTTEAVVLAAPVAVAAAVEVSPLARHSTTETSTLIGKIVQASDDDAV